MAEPTDRAPTPTEGSTKYRVADLRNGVVDRMWVAYASTFSASIRRSSVSRWRSMVCQSDGPMAPPTSFARELTDVSVPTVRPRAVSSRRTFRRSRRPYQLLNIHFHDVRDVIPHPLLSVAGVGAIQRWPPSDDEMIDNLRNRKPRIFRRQRFAFKEALERHLSRGVPGLKEAHGPHAE